jgi:two-component system, response regulator PdtaR
MTADSSAMPPGTVLIVEDEPLVALFLADVIEEMGQTVIGSVTTPEAALLAAAEASPQIAIIDAHLGRQGDGIALASQLQALHETRIIFLSGDASLSTNSAVHALKPLAVLQKPCLPSELEAALSAAVTSIAATE